MPTEVMKLDHTGIAEVASRASEVLAAGGLVVFPTETVYGVAARADRPDGVRRLRALKTREADQAFTVHLGAREDADRFVTRMPGLARRLIRKAWPGPLTLILRVDNPRSAPVMEGLNGSALESLYFEGTVGLRCPDDPVAVEVLSRAGGPVIASSANLAGSPPAWTGDAALKDLADRIDLLIDTGRTRYAKSSTIVRVGESSVEVVREGVYDEGMVDRLSTLRILFVCTGNTCRSPMAEGLARAMLAKRLDCSLEDLSRRGIIVQSAGTGGGSGGAADHAIAVMRRRGVDIADHASSPLTVELIRQSDYIFAMTSSHRARVVAMVPAVESRVSLLLQDEDVRDPLGGSEEEYDRCAATIENGLQQRLEEIDL